MKKYKITVNGKTYEVEVEEVGGTQQVSEVSSTIVERPKEASRQDTPKPSPAPVPVIKKAAPAGKTTITAPMPGTILSIKVKQGSNVSKGDVIMILEAMKMENEILAPQDGTISSIDVSEGATVNTSDLLATIQ